jgi:hypothetical protein
MSSLLGKYSPELEVTETDRERFKKWSKPNSVGDMFKGILSSVSPATRPPMPTTGSILELLEGGGDQAGRDLSDKDFEDYLTLLLEESS